MVDWNNEPLQLGLRRMSVNVQPAVRQMMVLAAAELDRLEVVGEAELTASRVRDWLHERGLDVHPLQKKKLARMVDEEGA